MDNYNETKKRLQLWELNKVYLESLKEKLELLEKEYGLQGISYDGIGGGSGEPSDSTGDTAMRLADKRRKLEYDIAKETQELHHLERVISKLTEAEKKIIIMFYPNRKSIKFIAKELTYSDIQIKRIKKEAMLKVIVGLYGRA